MLEEVEDMRGSANPATTDGLLMEAEGHFLSALLAWGTTRTLKEHIRLFEYQSGMNDYSNTMARRAAESLNHRCEQTAVGYLDLMSDRSSDPIPVERRPPRGVQPSDAADALFNIDQLMAELGRRVAVVNLHTSPASDPSSVEGVDTSKDRDSRVALDALAKLCMMNGRYDDALKCYLVMGALHSAKSLDVVEDEALALVNDETSDRDGYRGPYSFVLCLIENYHLHQSLLEAQFLPEGIDCSPICALVRLVGLKLTGDFLIDNCVAPQQTNAPRSSTLSNYAPGTREERRGTLPLDLVTDQLSGSPKLFHWYLHLVFTRKPEVYVKFSTTANPPPVITTLHKKHLDLYIKYANRDSAQALVGLEAYRVAEKTTPLLSFLKVILHLGAIGPVEVGKMLEIERRGGAGVSRTFALELAYIMENYGNDSESDALLILELYLKGAQSLMLAVAFAQRAKSHSAKLWEILIGHCLSTNAVESTSTAMPRVNGNLFGSLLEAAALSGADLAHLVAQIPLDMQVEGLRPRLVAAVTDYRLKVLLHSTLTEIAADEKALLFREVARRSRHGMRFDGAHDMMKTDATVEAFPTVNSSEELRGLLPPTRRTRQRPVRYGNSFSIAIR